MNFIHDLINSYGSFFSFDAIKEVVTNPASWGVIGTLVILEGLLSADNALVLAVMVRHLPKTQQKKALFYGLLGAYLFRFLAIGLGVFLVKITWVKVLGGAYLLWLSISHFVKKSSDDEEVQNKAMSFWRTVLAVELMDIAFSLDSVIAAFGVSDKVWVLFIGGMLGVLMMRSVAQLFLALIERIPEFEATAFVLIAIIGLKMIAASLFGFHINELVFFGILIAVFLATFVVHAVKKKSSTDQNTVIK
ncbi:TerC family protein [Bacillus sp. RG28]|uniref:TerC family protein n=1 Tax=Gottfriedia endophytica TaxID=2820819 RepID=A0A940NTC2_9BACI|nr:TerC family protein [Gottfriedia endophytica]MBP0726697.1 TerC family protein [Gottfriedia endophytica]